MKTIYARRNLGRPDLAIDGLTLEQDIADRVKRGETVRIVGLGTLVARWPTTAGDLLPPEFRLTLTAAVAKQAVVRRDPPDLGPYLADDVRHLARALGAPVEVWAPAKKQKGCDCKPCDEGYGDAYRPSVVTTVHQ